MLSTLVGLLPYFWPVIFHGQFFSIPKPYIIPHRGYSSFAFKKEMVDKIGDDFIAVNFYPSNGANDNKFL